MSTDAQLIHPTGKVNIAELCLRTEAIKDRLIDERYRLQVDYPHLRPSFDARLTCFSKLENVLGSFQLGCVFWAENLMSPDWWKKRTSYPESDLPILRGEFHVFLKLGLVHLSFSAVESNLRIFMRAIDPSAHAGSSHEFKRVYDDLFLRRLSAPMPIYVELLDMASRLGNTVHNNGVYFHKSGKAVDQPYKGQIYRFTCGKPIEFGGWPLLLSILSDLTSMLVDIARDPNIIGVKKEICDPRS
jgi:hypothetical protein